MKSFSLAKALVLVSMVAVVPLACGDDESNPKPTGKGGEPGAAGSDGRAGEPALGLGGSDAMGGAPMLPPGISLEPKTEQCSSEECNSGSVGLGAMKYYLDPCCTEEDDACGLNTSFLALAGAAFADSCQPKNQPGEMDQACPSPAPAMIPAAGGMITLDEFPGCCRPTGVCGVVVNEVSAGQGALEFGDLQLGCMDAAPFFPGEDPVPCGEGVGGGNAGGSGNAGGEPSAAGGNGPGGASGGAGGAD